MFTPRTSRILVLTAIMVMVAALPVVGQMDWKQLSPATSPSARADHAIAYDTAHQRVVLFGGRFLMETWLFDGIDWKHCFPTTSPPGRDKHEMAYDAARQRVVLFGGWDTTKFFHGTWEWDGQNWKNVTPKPPAVSPPARKDFAMVYDAAQRCVVLFGGISFHFPYYLNDTWVWDGQSWKLCNPTTSPSGRFTHNMAYDKARQRVVLFGGSNLNDTWEWDGSNWIQCNPNTRPPVRNWPAMAYDEARQRVVLFGGSHFYDTREWDGQDWKLCGPLTSPPGRIQHAMAYDAVRGRIVLFGGLTSGGWFNDTWVYTPTDLTASFYRVSVATGGNVALYLYAGAANIGKSYLLAGCMDSGGQRVMPLGYVTLLLNPDGYFWHTVMFPNTLIANSFGMIDGSGKATAAVQVPSGLTALIGTRFFHAYIVFKTSIDYASTPVPLTFGP